jgi:N6-L-threonylcarbamoyladenine synthase
VVHKIERALADNSFQAIYLGGGVTQNKRLRAYMAEKLKLPIFWPRLDLCLDNAAMIAGLAYHKQPLTSYDLDPETRIPFHRIPHSAKG